VKLRRQGTGAIYLYSNNSLLCFFLESKERKRRERALQHTKPVISKCIFMALSTSSFYVIWSQDKTAKHAATALPPLLSVGSCLSKLSFSSSEEEEEEEEKEKRTLLFTLGGLMENSDSRVELTAFKNTAPPFVLRFFPFLSQLRDSSILSFFFCLRIVSLTEKRHGWGAEREH